MNPFNQLVPKPQHPSDTNEKRHANRTKPTRHKNVRQQRELLFSSWHSTYLILNCVLKTRPCF